MTSDLGRQPGGLCGEGLEPRAFAVELVLARQPRLGDRSCGGDPRGAGSQRLEVDCVRLDAEHLADGVDVARRPGLGLGVLGLRRLHAHGLRKHRRGSAVSVDGRGKCLLLVGGGIEQGQLPMRRLASRTGIGNRASAVEVRLISGDRGSGSGEATAVDGELRGRLCQAGSGPTLEGSVLGDGLERVQVPTIGYADPGGLLEPVDDTGTHVVVGLAASMQVDPSVHEPALDLLEPARPEQPLQHGMPLGGGRPKERLEPSLRQHRDLGELGARHPEQTSDEVSRLVEPVGQRDPVTGPSFLDDHVCLDSSSSTTASLGSFPGGGAGEPEGPPADADTQDHPRLGLRRGMVAAQVTGGVPVARDLAVQGEANGVEHARLARSGVAGQEEQATGGELVEVDVHGVDEGSEGGDRELVEPHQRDTTASRAATRSGSSEQHSSASRRSSDSASVAADPRTWATKSSATS